jgi:nitrite reductase (NADH) small subunit
MSQWIDVCCLDDLQPDSGVCALVEGEQIAIFYMPREAAIYALSNYDPIGKANVLSRGLLGDVKGEPVVASPLFKQHFNLKTGGCLEEEGVTVNAYAVRLVEDRVEVKV